MLAHIDIVRLTAYELKYFIIFITQNSSLGYFPPMPMQPTNTAGFRQEQMSSAQQSSFGQHQQQNIPQTGTFGGICTELF